MTIGAEKLGPPGDAKKGIRAIRDWLQTKQLDFPELVLENGAGLSRMERLSARHMGEMLRVAWQSPVMPEFVSSLPVLSVDGTMSKRLVSSDVAGRAHLKSGSLDGVKAIGGYLLDRKGRYWVIVFMVNHANAKASQPAQDALLEWLYDLD